MELQEKDFPAYVCNPEKLTALITLPNDTDITAAQISEELCRLNNTMLSKVLDMIVVELDVGIILKNVSLFLEKLTLLRELFYFLLSFFYYFCHRQLTSMAICFWRKVTLVKQMCRKLLIVLRHCSRASINSFTTYKMFPQKLIFPTSRKMEPKLIKVKFTILLYLLFVVLYGNSKELF